MKKQILISLIIISSGLTMNAQWNGTNPIWTTSNIGIGTVTPISKLHINSSEREALRIYGDGNSINYLSIWQGTGAAVLDPIGTGKLYLGYDQKTDVYMGLNDGKIGIGTTTPNEKLEINGNLKFINNGSKIFLGANDYIQFTDGNSDGFKFIYDDLERLRITNTGNIGIGTMTPQYKLDVEGTIRAKEIKVCLLGGCDFVFKKDYKLMNLSELEKFVTTKQHLPEIASEKEMIEDGLNMKEFQMKLLQKIEELTLYTIEQNKELKRQNDKIEKQNQEFKILKIKIKKLESNKK